MTTYVALLRAVNLAGRNKVAMADLRALLQDLGFQNPSTLLQSGNAVFRQEDSSPAQLERILEEAAGERLGLKTDFLVRSAADWRSVIEGNPFPEEVERDPGHVLVVFMKQAPDPSAVKALEEAIVGNEVVRVKGREAYCIYPDGIGRSKLTSALIENKLRTRGTGRNWNTVLKLMAKAEDS